MTPHHPARPDRVLTQLGLIKLGQTDLAGVLDRVVDFARQGLPDAMEVSITLVGEGGPYTAAYTGDSALVLDELQYRLQAGPCLEAARGQATVHVRDTAHDARWNGWPQQAAAAGAGSVLSVALPILDDVGGALNIYGGASEAFDEKKIRTAQRFAEHAAVTLANAHLYDRTASLAHQMQSAMEHRAVIEQAKGIVMAERRCTPEEAFAVLTKASQDSNRKLRDLAAAIVARARSSERPPSSGPASGPGSGSGSGSSSARKPR
jgi:GAF domain-containing protein